QLRLRLREPCALIVAEEKGPARHNGPAQRAAADALGELAPRNAGPFVFPPIRIEPIVAAELEQRSVKRVGALLDRGVDDGTGGLAEFRRIRASLDAELLQGVDGRLNDLRAALLQVGRKRVVVGAVERVVVPGRRIAVRVEERILAAAR